MAVPAPPQMLLLGPRIGVQQIMPLRMHAGLQHQSPEIDQICAYTDAVCRHASRPVDAAREPVRRLVDADHEMLREMGSQMQRRPADAAAGIQNQRLAAGRAPCARACLECIAVIGSYRLAKQCARMLVDLREQLVVRGSLRAADETGIGMHECSIPSYCPGDIEAASL